MNTIFREDTADPEDLSFVADALLAPCARVRDAPFCTEDGFQAKLTRLKAWVSDSAVEIVSRRVDSLLSIECRDVLRGGANAAPA